MRLAVFADVLQLEALGHLKVELGRVQLPGSAERVLDVDVDLGPIEGAFARLLLIGQPIQLERVPQVGLGCVPNRGIADRFLWPRTQVERRLQTEDGVDRLLELEHTADLVLHLVWAAVDVRVVHRQLPHPQEAIERPGALVAQQAIVLGKAQWQVAIAARLEAIHERGLGTVHRLEGVLLFLDFELVHAVLVEVPVARLAPQVRLDQRRRADLLVAAAIQLVLQERFELMDDAQTLG